MVQQWPENTPENQNSAPQTY